MPLPWGSYYSQKFPIKNSFLKSRLIGVFRLFNLEITKTLYTHYAQYYTHYTFSTPFFPIFLPPLTLHVLWSPCAFSSPSEVHDPLLFFELLPINFLGAPPHSLSILGGFLLTVSSPLVPQSIWITSVSVYMSVANAIGCLPISHQSFWLLSRLMNSVFVHVKTCSTKEMNHD